MGGSLRLGRVLGIPLSVSYSWFLVLALVVLVLDSHLGSRYPFWDDAQRWATATVVALLFFACIVAHEMAHSLVAIGRGIPVKGITLFIFGGVSQISREANSPRVELSIAIVGPLLSLLLGAVFLGIAFATQNANSTLHAGSLILAYANFGLGIFNLVPGFPLDGGRVLRAGVWRLTGDPWKATRIAVTAGRVAGLLLILGGLALTAACGRHLAALAGPGGLVPAADGVLKPAAGAGARTTAGPASPRRGGGRPGHRAGVDAPERADGVGGTAEGPPVLLGEPRRGTPRAAAAAEASEDTHVPVGRGHGGGADASGGPDWREWRRQRKRWTCWRPSTTRARTRCWWTITACCWASSARTG